MSAGDDAAPLAERLAAEIRASGPISVATYMQICLGDRQAGYYTRQEPFGTAGDFVTAPEISQMFGELIGAWLVECWQRAGAPGRFALVELGPGRGTLLADILRVARLRPAFLDAAELHLVEVSDRLADRQKQVLDAAGLSATWHGGFDGVPDLPLLLIANEFFDALPIRQFVWTEAGWAERLVGLDEVGKLAFGLGPPSGRTEGAGAGVEAGAVREEAAAAEAVMAAVAGRIVDRGGAALAIDYGFEGPAFGDTLQAVRQHQPIDPLALPGLSDLTAHVDFAALGGAARAAGASVAGPVGQGMFLDRLGLAARARRLAENRDEKTQRDIEAAATRLAGEQGMGRLFKVLGVSRSGILLPGFD